ncbi:CocE/NonD family hydrolase [Nonomuraea sp. NPDC049158]|uniref:CocE/NonD family hydrolase n=1 Tax=Nonomuraea sp. NPDC049158 TaxID=3155649 RepID=UPI0033FCA318
MATSWHRRVWSVVLAGVLAAVLLAGGQAPARADRQAPTPWPGGRWEPGPARYGTTVVSDVPVRMDDGVTLTATVAYPTDPATGRRASGRFPVILQQTPYTDAVNPFFVPYGYIFATVRSRGAGTSGGEFGYVSARDHRDGVRTVYWAARELDGSNGVVGGYGCSYAGETQLYTAAGIGRGSPLKTIIPTCTAQDYLRETFLVDGILTGDFPFLKRAAASVGDTPSAKSFFADLVTEVESGGDAAYNRDFWRSRQPITFAQDIVDNDIPALLWSGWDDVVIRGATEFYTALQNAYHDRPVQAAMDPGQPVTGRYQIIVGPWGHGQGLDNTIMLEWYDTWLKHANTGIDRTSTPMHLYELRADRWVNAARYPIVTDYTTYYLHANGALKPSRSAEGGDPIAWAAPDTAGGTLTYSTPPLADGATLAGPVSAAVYASSSNTNLVLIATLSDVAPDGTAAPITFGAVLGSQRALDPRKTWRDRDGTIIRPYTRQTGDSYLTPGEVTRFDIALHPRLWAVRPGHSVRLTLTTQTPAAACAGANVLPCALTAPAQATVPGGVYQVRRGSSSVSLPLLPAGCFRTAASAVTPTSGGFSQPMDWAAERPGHPCQR